MSGYLTVDGEYSNLIVIERSKFICDVKGIKDEEEAKAFIESIRKREGLATHHCYAYIADDKGQNQKFSDDGEPQGTAGMPMLNVLKNKKLFKTVAVVTRYFGGIKLGAGGLVRAYSNSVAECVEKATVAENKPIEELSVKIDYDLYSKLVTVIENHKTKILKTEYTDRVEVIVVVAKENENYVKDFCEKIVDALNGRVIIEKIKDGYYPFK